METLEKTASLADNERFGGLCPIETAPDRFRAKVRIDPKTGCWNWTGGCRRTRYKATVYSYGVYRRDFAHRFAYEFFIGPIPKHLELDHRCYNKLCVNPAHLEAVTHQINCARRMKSGPARNPDSQRSRNGFYLRGAK